MVLLGALSAHGEVQGSALLASPHTATRLLRLLLLLVFLGLFDLLLNRLVIDCQFLLLN